MNRRAYWNEVWQAKRAEDVSWYQRRPDLSLASITCSGTGRNAGTIDVGGGASRLVDCLLDEGYTNLAVLDLSGSALQLSRTRLGERAATVDWFEADVRSFVPPRRFACWHDRALFHFLTDEDDRRRYLSTLRQTLLPGGSVVIATFALDGPAKCSGLDVVRYDESMMCEEVGAGFRLEEIRRETHITPWDSEQRFIYFRFLSET